MNSLRIVSFIFLWSLFGFFLSELYSQDPKNVSQAKEKLSVITTKINKHKPQISKKQKQKKRAETQLRKLSRSLRYTELKLKNQKKKLRRAEKRKKHVEQELRSVKSKYKGKNDLLVKRINEIYRNQNLGVLEFLFSPNDFLVEMDSSIYFKKLMKIDLNLVGMIKQEYQELISKREELELQAQKVRSIKDEVQRQERRLSYQKNKKKNFVSLLKSELAEMERQYEDLERASTDLTAFIIKKGKGKLGFYGTGRFLRPVKGWISSRFGVRRHPIFRRKIRHNGVDFAAPKGYKIKASDSGFVIFSGRDKKYRGYGKVTVIDHGISEKYKKRLTTFYAHQSRILVKEGDYVKKGDEIGWVGSTGYSTGPHLHFEIRRDGVPVDPLSLIK